MDDPSSSTSPPQPPPLPPPAPGSSTFNDAVSDNKIWTTQPKSFPKNDNLEGVSVAQLNEFPENDQDTQIASKRRSVKFANVTVSDEDEEIINSSEPKSPQPDIYMRNRNSRFWRARDSIFVHKDVLRKNSSAETDDEDELLNEEQFHEIELTEGFSNYGFRDYGGNEQQNQQQNMWSFEDEDDELKALRSDAKDPWDTPASIPPVDDDASAKSGWSEFFLKLLKVATYGMTFVLILGLAIIAKLSFHLIASMTRPGKTVTNCNKNLEGILEHDKHYHAIHSLLSPERIAWVWILYFVMITPEVYIFLRSIKVCLFKSYEMPSFNNVFWIFLTNTSEVIGASLFAYLVLPSIDVVSGLIFTNCVCLVPSGCLILRISQQNNDKKLENQEDGRNGGAEKPKLAALKFYMLAFVLQIFILFAWPIALYFNNKETPSRFGADNDSRDQMSILAWALPLSGILISIGYWENFIPDKGTGFLENLCEIKRLSIVSKYAVFSFVSVWKIILYFIMLILSQIIISWNDNESSVSDMIDKLFGNFGYAFNKHPIDLVRENSVLQDIHQMDSNPWTPINIGLINVFASMFCHRAVIFVCKIRIQPFSFGLPIHLVLPISISIMNLLGNFYFTDVCILSNSYQPFEYIFWNIHYNIFSFNGFWNKVILLIWLCSFISKAITVSHVWIASKERLGSSDRLFVLPFYSSSMIEQSIMLSRRVDEDLFSSVINRTEEDEETEEKEADTASIITDINDTNLDRVRVYACATVWHETSDELLMMLKSIMRMDYDQACRKLATKTFDATKAQVEYYDFQTHLFVDDAFTFDDEEEEFNENNQTVNSYVETLINVLDKAASNVHQTSVKLRPPKIFITPYGGRLEWQLPGRSKLIAHLKDKLKIRHRKRWSQVMYMYYLLGFKIFEKCKDEAKRDEILRNTFILALDGDINFRPEAVLLLIDLMKKNKNLGAACGRIHPIGSGPIAWYQVFEYAISHWLQKATEHVFGCVLCSPGCFSLFRSYALAHINVMHRYTTKPDEAIHYVQYDQGEDRWLCTLMLQEGFRVEYSAAADSFTHCPEGFDEFFIQRRRWGPSTMANVFDLLQNSKQTVKKNDNISSLFILYQTAMLFGTILSPGTIFLMLIGAMNTAFNMPTSYSFYINFVPVLAFVIICFTCNNDFQLLVAQILTTFYAMLMLAVLVSTAIEIKEKTIFAPSVLFFVGMMAVFLIAAIIHPQEFYCLFPLPVYMMTIPSMYLLLTIYSVINMNVVTWGTRENPQSKRKQPTESVKPAEKQGFFHDIRALFNTGSSWANCTCCSSTKVDEELIYLRDINSTVRKVNDEVVYVKAQMDMQTRLAKADFRRRSSFKIDPLTRPLLGDSELNDENSDEEEIMNDFKETLEQGKKDTEKRNKVKFGDDLAWVDQIKNIYKKAPVVEIKSAEKIFWVKFIEKYLKPIDDNPKHKEKVEKDLINLRNKVVFAFGIINIIFVLFVFLLQINKSTFGFKLNIRGSVNGTEHDEETGDDIKTYSYTVVDLDPIGTVLILFFGFILLLQTTGMFLHRFETITHLLAFTDISFIKIREEDANDEKTIREKSVDVVKIYIDTPPKPDRYEYYDLVNYFNDVYLSKRKGLNTFKKITKKMNIQRRSSVAHILKEKQNLAIARYSSFKSEEESDFDSDSSGNNDTRPRTNTVSSNESRASMGNNSYTNVSINSNESQQSENFQNFPPEPEMNSNNVHDLSRMLAEVIEDSMNFLQNQRQQEQEREQEEHQQTAQQNEDVNSLQINSSNEVQNNEQIELQDMNSNNEQVELQNMNSNNETFQPAQTPVSSPEIITPTWTAANLFTSHLDESTHL